MPCPTFREGLLPKAIALPLTTSCTAFLAGVEGDGSPVSSTSSGIPPFAFSCELSGPGASLVGIGVIVLETVFLKAGFFGRVPSFAIELTVPFTVKTPLDEFDEFGVPLEGALLKKL